MKRLNTFTAAALAALTLTACVEQGATRSEPTAMRQASGNAESACMSAVNSNYGGKVTTINVLSSEFSQANSQVMLAAVGVRGGSKTEKWRCLVSNDGKVQELTAVR
jgi:signal recognition particle GTPase